MKQKVTKVSFINLGPELKVLETRWGQGKIINIENLNSSDKISPENLHTNL
jgi:hypothetical protein